MSIFSFIRNLFKKEVAKPVKVKLTQSLVYDNIKSFVVFEQKTKVVNTQVSEFEKSLYVPVVLADSQAYWILNNTLYVADQIDGMIDKETTRPVDTMHMDKVQLDKTIYIVDALTEGAENDNWNSRNKNL